MVHACVDVTPLLLRSAGVKTYLFQWASALARTRGRNELRLYPFEGLPSVCDHEASLVPFGETVRHLAWLHAANRFPALAWPFHRRRYDLFHVSNQIYSPPPMPFTSTIFDLTCWIVPELHSPANVAAAKRVAERVWKKARGLIAISESAKSDAVRILRLPPDRIEVIYPGVAPEFFEDNRERAKAARDKYGLSERFVLFNGTIEPRKSAGTLLDAWEMLPPGMRGEWQLVLAGPRGWERAAVLARVNQPPPGVRYLGYVPEQDLPGLYRAASLFVYPSIYEGFGLPPAQALASGVPVIATNISSLPEVVGQSGLLVPPRNRERLAEALTHLLGDDGARARLAAGARAQAARFGWEETARQSWRYFERTAGRVG